jgi:UDP-N-acetylglucosamine:LPS N-acetylglucosamine transferase
MVSEQTMFNAAIMLLSQYQHRFIKAILHESNEDPSIINKILTDHIDSIALRFPKIYTEYCKH